MKHLRAVLILAAGAVAPAFCLAGGSNYTVNPGSNPGFAGKVREWPVPTPEFARDPAPGPDGAIYIAVMFGNKIARFDPKSQTFKEWDLPAGAIRTGSWSMPRARSGTPATATAPSAVSIPGPARSREYKAPSGGDPHTLVTMTATARSGSPCRAATASAGWTSAAGKITEYPISGRPYGMALDRQGNVWFCRMGADKLGKIDPEHRQDSEFDTGSGAHHAEWRPRPTAHYGSRCTATASCSTSTRPRAKRSRSTPLPAARGGPYAVSVDGAGVVWVNEINTDTVVRFEPASGKMRVMELPSATSASAR